jgi:hypothetical protein
VVAVGWLAFHGGAVTPGGAVLDRLEQSVRRPLPAAPARPVSRPDRVWVPDRYVARPDGTVLHVPAHWERLLDGEVHAPPLVACSASGECVLVPAGRRPPPERRLGP